MKFDLFEASKSLGRINLNLGSGMHEMRSLWCRVVLAEKEQYNPKTHRHSFFELHLCLDGTGDFTVDDKKISLCKNEFLLVSPSTEHRIDSQSSDFRKFIWGFNVKDERLSTELWEKCKNGVTGTVCTDVLTSLNIILQNAYEKQFGYYDVIKGQLSYIFALIIRDICEIREIHEYRKKSGLIFDEIREYVTDNLQNCPTSDDIAAQFSKSPGALDKLCMSECGMTVSALKKELQFEKIKLLLSDTDYTLDSIAEKCGFADRFTMGKFFKKHEGMPPGEFRKSNRK